MPRPGRRPSRQPDMDEIGVNSFLIHNAKVIPWIKGEGTVVGNHFELLTWRREGLLGRLRERGFNIRTIEDRLDYLPELPEPTPIGELGRRELQHAKERFAHFDLIHLRWREVPSEQGQREFRLRAGWVLRRRRGRGHADYYQAIPEKGDRIGLLPLNETEALLRGYAQASELSEHTVRLEPVEGGYQLSELLLPPPHREILKILTSRSARPGVIPEASLEHARQLLQSLGLSPIPFK